MLHVANQLKLQAGVGAAFGGAHRQVRARQTQSEGVAVLVLVGGVGSGAACTEHNSNGHLCTGCMHM